MLHTLCFSLQNAVYFIMLTFLVKLGCQKVNVLILHVNKPFLSCTPVIHTNQHMMER